MTYPPFLSSLSSLFSDDEEDEDEDEDDFVSDGLLREDSLPSGSKLKAEWQTLSPDQLSKKMFEIVDDVNAVFQVSCGCGFY